MGLDLNLDLNYPDPAVMEEKAKASAFSNGFVLQWPGIDINVPPSVPFTTAEVEKMERANSPSGFLSLSTGGAFDQILGTPQAGSPISMMTRSPLELSIVDKFPLAQQSDSIFVGTCSKQPSLGDTPVTTPWLSSESSEPHTHQFTVFYGNKVHVYDNVSHSKGHTILFFIRNGITRPSREAQLRAEAPAFIPPASNTFFVNQTTHTAPGSEFSSPVAFPSFPIHRPATNDRVVEVRPSTVNTRSDLSDMMNSLGPDMGNTNMESRGAALHRKLSLKRFLDKRKKRALDVAPYHLDERPS